MTKMKTNKKAQEEMVGFAVIIVIIAVIMVIFLSFSLRGSKVQSVDSYEVEGFIQGLLRYTTDCKDSNLEFLPIQDLIERCESDGYSVCSDGRKICDVMGNNLEEISKESWIITEDSPVRGYMLNISSDSVNDVYSIQNGNITQNYKGSSQSLPGRIIVSFSAYY